MKNAEMVPDTQKELFFFICCCCCNVWNGAFWLNNSLMLRKRQRRFRRREHPRLSLNFQFIFHHLPTYVSQNLFFLTSGVTSTVSTQKKKADFWNKTGEIFFSTNWNLLLVLGTGSEVIQSCDPGPDWKLTESWLFWIFSLDSGVRRAASSSFVSAFFVHGCQPQNEWTWTSGSDNAKTKQKAPLETWWLPWILLSVRVYSTAAKWLKKKQNSNTRILMMLMMLLLIVIFFNISFLNRFSRTNFVTFLLSGGDIW